MLGCSSYLHQYREAVMLKAEEALDALGIVQMDANGFLQAIERVKEELEKLEGSIEGQAASIASQVCAKAACTVFVTVTCHNVHCHMTLYTLM